LHNLIAAAREQCRRLSLKHAAHRGVGGLKEAKAVERRQYVAEKEAAAAQATHTTDAAPREDPVAGVLGDAILQFMR
jgi:hypothetical protein